MTEDPFELLTEHELILSEAETVKLSAIILDLIEQLKDERSELRLKAAGRLRDVGDARAIEPLCAALADVHPDVRASAAKALAHIGDACAIEPLCKTLKDSYKDVRICAADALGHIGDSRAVYALCSLFTDTYQDVRAAAADALTNIGSPSVGPLCGCSWTWIRSEHITIGVRIPAAQQARFQARRSETLNVVRAD